MKETGNSDAVLCGNNLLLIQRGEVPLDVLRGLPSEIIDRPRNLVEPELKRAIKFCIDEYEPRVDVDEIIGG